MTQKRSITRIEHGATGSESKVILDDGSELVGLIKVSAEIERKGPSMFAITGYVMPERRNS